LCSSIAHIDNWQGAFLLSFMAIKRKRRWAAGLFTESIVSEPLHSLPLHKFPGLVEMLDDQYIQKKTGSFYEPDISVISVFNYLHLVGIKNNSSNFVNRTMVMWCLGRRPFVLLTHIPSPMEVLRMQAAGQRVVTMFLTTQELMSYHVAKLQYMSGQQLCRKDALDFLVHDLKHMDHFSDPAIAAEQVGFFRAMLRLSEGRPKRFFKAMFPADEALWFELEYLISDMYDTITHAIYHIEMFIYYLHIHRNCYVPHLMKYLLAKLVNAIKRKVAVAAPAEDVSADGGGRVVCGQEEDKGDYDDSPESSEDRVVVAAHLPSFLLECVQVWTSVLCALGMRPPATASLVTHHEECDRDGDVSGNVEISSNAFVGGMFLLMETHGFTACSSQLLMWTATVEPLVLIKDEDKSSHQHDVFVKMYDSSNIEQQQQQQQHCDANSQKIEAYSQLCDVKRLCKEVTPEIAGESLRSYFRALGEQNCKVNGNDLT
jgi:hypothetical protein